MVQQDVHLFSWSALDHIRLGDESISVEEARRAAQEAEVTNWARHLPRGLETPLEERGGGLSQGQRQLVGIARVMARRSRVLVLDEATSSVDPETEHAVQTALSRVLENRASLVIAHWVSTIRGADRIVVLHRGRIRETGTHAELLEAGGIYRRLYELQFSAASPWPRGDTGLRVDGVGETSRGPRAAEKPSPGTLPILAEMSPPKSIRGPFRPGSGGLPPYIAGRAREQKFFLDLLADLEDRVPPASEVVLHGPRGNGKTTLLAWLRKEAKSRPRVDVVRMNPTVCRTPADLAKRLLSEAWWKRLTPSEVAVRGITWRPGQGQAPTADEVLTARASRRPLLFLLDEAHNLTPEVGSALLNASQEVRLEHPLLLVLAGTPEIRAHLTQMSASFWSRSRPLPIGRLDPESSAAAIERPLADEGVGIEREALERILSNSHDYPFFLQLWGEAVWQELRKAGGPPRRITAEMTAAAQADFDFQKGFYYQERYVELLRLDRLPSARAVAEAFAADPVLDDEGLGEAVRRGLGADAERAEVLATVGSFAALGYIWRPEGTVRWEPGIPSLMTYIIENTRAPA